MDELDEFLKQVLAEQKQWEADPTPQTPVYELLAAGELDEAEAVARQTVFDLEKEIGSLKSDAVDQSGNAASTNASVTRQNQTSTEKNDTQQSLLAEALIAHGIALARLKLFNEAQGVLEQAIAVAQEVGALDKAGIAALTMIEELEHLPRETLLRAYEQANAGFSKMRNRKLQWRVIDAATKVMAGFWGKMDPHKALEILLTPPPGFPCASDRLQGKALSAACRSPEEVVLPIMISERLIYIIELKPELSQKKGADVPRRPPTQ